MIDIVVKGAFSTAQLTPSTPENIYAYLSSIIQRWLNNPNCSVMNVEDLSEGTGVVITIAYPPKLRDSVLQAVTDITTKEQYLQLPHSEIKQIECAVSRLQPQRVIVDR